MIAFLLALLMSTQGIPALPNQGGTVTGTLKTADGKAATGVRVVAVARPDSVVEAANAASMASLTETDEEGRYRLENIPPGHYFIAAGRVDLQTYYPGVLELPGATDILITSGVSVPGIDFSMKASSVGRSPDGMFFFGSAGASIPLKIAVDGGGRVPVFSSRGFPRLVFTRTGDSVRTTSSLDQSTVMLAGPAISAVGSEYKVSIENLPDGYALKSIVYGSTDLRIDTLKIPAAQFGMPAVFQLGQSTTVQLQGGSVLVIFGGNATVSQTAPTSSPLGAISVTLTNVPLPASTQGVRVSGRSGNTGGPRSIYISGRPGTFYSDGTFEFHGVPAGRHVVMTSDTPRASRPLGAVVIVGGSDVDGLQLEETFVLPSDFQLASVPAADTRAPGTMIRMASVRGRVVEETTRQAIPEGIVYFGGKERASFRLQNDGSFEIPHLLPGRYTLEIQVFGHRNISQTIDVGEEDIALDLSSRLVVTPVE
jgi:hypothetical protein